MGLVRSDVYSSWIPSSYSIPLALNKDESLASSYLIDERHHMCSFSLTFAYVHVSSTTVHFTHDKLRSFFPDLVGKA